MQKEKAKRSLEEDKLLALEESLREIDGVKAYVPIDPTELCLVLSVLVPKKCKVLEFEKYNGCIN